MTKTQLVEKICELDSNWKNKRGRLYYMNLDELIEVYERLKNGRIDNNNVMARFQTD